MSSKKDNPETAPVMPAASRGETAEYVADLLDSLQRIAVDKEMPILAHLIDLARTEARRNAA